MSDGRAARVRLGGWKLSLLTTVVLVLGACGFIGGADGESLTTVSNDTEWPLELAPPPGDAREIRGVEQTITPATPTPDESQPGLWTPAPREPAHVIDPTSTPGPWVSPSPSPTPDDEPEPEPEPELDWYTPRPSPTPTPSPSPSPTPSPTPTPSPSPTLTPTPSPSPTPTDPPCPDDDEDCDEPDPCDGDDDGDGGGDDCDGESHRA